MNDLTDITIVLDRSGSMDSVVSDTIGGFNRFLDDQQAAPGRAAVSLIQFDSEYEPNYTASPVKDAPRLSESNYTPRSRTALLDAIGRTINATGARLSAMPDEERPSKVIFVIITDGLENASREFSRSKVFEMIEHQRSAYSWEFTYLGANQDAIAVGASLGVPVAAAMNYAHTGAGTQAVFAAASSAITRGRTTGEALVYTEEERSSANS